LPRKFHGQRSLVGYSAWGRKESKMWGGRTFKLREVKNHMEIENPKPLAE